MDEDQIKEHYRRDINFHLRCAKESIQRLMGKLNPKDVVDIGEAAVCEDRYNLITAVIAYPPTHPPE